MFFGRNLFFLRKRSGITQEALSQQLGVSRQAVSKWEAGEATPELGTLMELADLFGCSLDALLREDLTLRDSVVSFVCVKGFRAASYAVISADAQRDAKTCLNRWLQESGLLEFPGFVPKYMEWGFPYVSEEQKRRFGMHGFVCACLLPEGFLPQGKRTELHVQEDCSYAVMTIAEPHGRDSRLIAQTIQTILAELRERGIAKSATDGFLPCFEHRYEQNGQLYADIYVQCRDAGKKLKLPEKEI